MPKPDVERIEALVALCQLIIEDCNRLSAYASTGTDAASQHYATHHQVVFGRLKQLLGL